MCLCVQFDMFLVAVINSLIFTLCVCVCHAAPGGDLCPAAGRDGNVVWRRPDSLYAHGYIAARSFHGLHAQQPQLLFRGLMFIHRALVGRPMPLPVLPVLLTYIQYIYKHRLLIKEVHEEKEMPSSAENCLCR